MAATVRVLLDTHAVVWAMTDPARLSDAALDAIRDPSVSVLVSAVSAWELATKVRIGKLPVGDEVIAGLAAEVRALGAEPLPITIAHGLRAGAYAAVHRDPFDRMLAAQAELEDVRLVTVDRAFEAFPVRVLW